MPHLTLEYTSNLEEWASDPGLLLSLHRLLESVAAIKIGNCKSRWRMVEEWVVGDGQGESAFVHLDLRFLEGRALDKKQAVGAGAAELLRSHFEAAFQSFDVQITVDVQDIRRSTYFKYPPGTLEPPTLSLV